MTTLIPTRTGPIMMMGIAGHRSPVPTIMITKTHPTLLAEDGQTIHIHHPGIPLHPTLGRTEALGRPEALPQVSRLNP